MRKIKLVKTVVPELVAYEYRGAGIFRDYRCECGMGVGEEYSFCPYCGSSINWNVLDKKSKEFKKMLDGL